MSGRRFDTRKHDAAYWEARLDGLGGELSKPALAIARQRLRQWCALNGGLTEAELRGYLDDVQNVISQAGIRQGLIRRPRRRAGADDDSPPPARPRPRLRLIK